ncbi:CAP domain-containing protein [Streptomyces phyllanthi]|uniref:CAP domain-containing protein n=1 Tax=Streptomyces phyllanthi TaxID=1803180 RepID=A0A5N8W0E5_9ACTN|nr:CAP domain-containing protein [Streptomyces phyllanthi]MPY40980.1 CAP domain-containing protein [Streptomyces phyllanthi]
MGRHRRSAAGRAARGRATGVAHAQDVTPEHYGPENLYGFAAVLEAETSQGRRSHRKQKKTVTPVKTGLLGVSAAVALGTAAVATGVLPGGDKYAISGGSSDTVVPASTSPSGLETQQGGTDGTADRGDESTSRNSERETSPSASPSTATPSTTPPKEPSAEETESKKPEKDTDDEKAGKKPEKESSSGLSAEVRAEAEVLRLVNVEREKAGCSPVAANSALADLAGAFSDDMAKRGFFDHTDPEGNTPWDRAAALGITDLGGENIARGQATAEAVMEAWMNSPGHRANILNCDFKTLGVGVSLGQGGPWWTQDFGY